VRPPYYSGRDHRYVRPHWSYVRPAPYAYRPPPARTWYRPYYTRWYVHPYYRSAYATTCVVGFGFTTYAWTAAWTPPPRAGWAWVSGVWVGGMWTPGYWAPLTPAPVGFVYVPGYWNQTAYVEGFYRPAQRDDGDWTWVEGYYLDDGTFVRGHWRPAKPGPEGYTWEPGFWDGETWVDGFWRPEYRPGFTWVSAWFDADGIFHTGYWAPLDDQPGSVWIPGWFDGNQWIEGYWVASSEYEATDATSWEPPEGWDAGWDVVGMGDGQILSGDGAAPAAAAPAPLGLPVDVTDLP
jgi:hypothetical protein